MTSDAPLALPAFLKMLTNAPLSPAKAMAIAGKIYKMCNTPSALGFLTDARLNELGVKEKDERRLTLAAVRKAGYKDASPRKAIKRVSDAEAAGSSKGNEPLSDPSPRKKRKRDDGRNEFLPDPPADEAEEHGSFDFFEVSDEEALKTKSAVVNRAPVMQAWATVVAERLGFKREEALSIASVYTELNAVSKGVSLGLYDKGKGKGSQATVGGAQPYIDLMGRRVPLLKSYSGQWRALSGGTPVSPAAAFSYIQRALRQTAPFVLGAMRVAAESYAPAELNRVGFALYADFRPAVAGWGERGSVSCLAILGARKKGVVTAPMSGVLDAPGLVKVEDGDGDGDGAEPEMKKPKVESDDEYDAAIDDISAADLAGIP